MKRSTYISLLSIVFFAISSLQSASALSLNLDSIATWGKFPRFCVRTYRWGDKFFNGYDTTFVKSTGYKFNVKVTTDSWSDGYRFMLPNKTRIQMISDPSTSAGLHLTYLAVSAGYDVNISQLMSGAPSSRKRWRFGFNCMLFAAEAYYMKNDVGTTIRRFGPAGEHKNLDIPFNGINNTTLGVDAYYFFNHKRYSEAATFGFSRIQKKNQGAFYTGFSFYRQKLDFDFSLVPENLQQFIPETWQNKHYRVNTFNYAIRVGYGYNWVFAPKWVLGISESPIIGIRKGFVNSDIDKYSLSLYNRMKLAVVWNSGRFFFGATGKFELAIVNDQKTTYAGGTLTAEAVFGIRFNIW